MKFKDNKTGFVVSTENPLVIGQYQKHSDRYIEIKEQHKKPAKK